MEIRRLDAADPEAMAAWHATYLAAQVHGQDHPSPWMLEEMRASFLGGQLGRRLEPFGGYVDGACVTTGVLELPQMDNLDVARVDVGTRPEDRRRGHGSAMLGHLTALAVTHGRGTLQAEATWPYDAPADGAGTPGADFLTGHDFVFSLGDVKQVLELPVEEALLDRLAKQSSVHHADYRLRDFVGPVPEDIVDGFGVLIGSLTEEAPKGEMDLEAELFDAARIRADEAVLAAAGRTKYATVAVARSGELVAYSELAVPVHDPARVYQWGTLVRPEHRGHRLGMATKVHNLRRLQEGEPARTTLTTYNAEVNSHMVAVNEALGFRPVGRLGEFQRRLRPAAA
jgi:GNAT superfamily N-acetyltransferase